MDLPAGSSRESPDAAAWRGFALSAAVEVDKLQADYEVLVDASLAIVDQHSAEAIVALAAMAKMEQRLSWAREQRALAFAAHSAFLVASVSANRIGPAEDPSGKGKAPAAPLEDAAEALINPKMLKSKLPEPSEGWKDAAGKPHKQHSANFEFAERAAWIV